MDDLPLLIESICIKNQKIQLLEYHNKRANEARFSLFGIVDNIDFNDIIDINNVQDAIVKCRIVYGEEVLSIEYNPYSLRPIHSLKLVEIDDDFNYRYKYLDRTMLDHYFAQREDQDDIIMIQNGFVTDSYYGNLAFLKNNIWYTPKRPLLQGTKRESLIVENKLVQKQIQKEEIPTFESVRIFNAMIEFGQIELSTLDID